LAQAVELEYSLSSLGAGRWQYDYTLVNPDASLVFDEITVYFQVPAVQAIESFATPAGWDSLTVQPDAALPADGFVDSVRTAGPVPANSTITGFSVVFDAAPSITPGPQSFELALSNGSGGFQVVASGTTSLVPEPAAFGLMLAGAIAIGAFARRRAGRAGRDDTFRARIFEGEVR
jgi:hypothetical protein